MADLMVTTSESGGVLTITLDRPDRLNAMTGAMSAQLMAALTVAAQDRARAVLLTGAGKGFCAGQDLADPAVAGPDADIGAVVDGSWNPAIRAIKGLAKPVLAAVNGVAAGAGANLALACDIVLAARSAKFIQPFCKLGLVPDGGGTYHLPRLVGMARAKGLALLGDAVPAEQAEAWGMIWKVYPDEALLAEAHKLAAHLATQPTFGLGLAKQAIHAAADNTLHEQLDLERDLQRRAGRSPDYKEGVRAFNEKRAPKFTGRESE